MNFFHGLGKNSHWQKPSKQLRLEESKHSNEESQADPFDFLGRQLLAVSFQ